ncbi:MAG: HAMP domain-containing sensor histidine kinase [Polyangiales bacterium]
MAGADEAPDVSSAMPRTEDLETERRLARGAMVLGSVGTVGGVVALGLGGGLGAYVGGTLAIGLGLASIALARRLDARARSYDALRTSLAPVVADVERERHLASLGEVSAMLAHEIRNPIASAKGHAQLLVEQTEPGSKLRAKAERVEHEITRLERLTNDLLVFARTGKLRTRPADVRVLVEQAASMVSKEIEVRVPGEPLVVDVDAGRLLQVLENLLRNALRHGRPPIRITASTRGESFVVEVLDHGPGIPEDRLAQIFEPFVTDATVGTGLGLAVVRRVVEMHGGHVVADNHPGGGARFTVTLPMRRATTTEDAAS